LSSGRRARPKKFYAREAEFGGMEVSDAKRLNAIEDDPILSITVKAA